MSPPAGRTPYSISQLTSIIRLRLEEHFAELWVVGEVSNFTRAQSGHLYFTLKDAKAQLRCILTRGIALRLRFDPTDGMHVLARGALSVYEPRGEYQLLVEELQPRGLGAAEIALRQLKQKLSAKGYFDTRAKRRLPEYPRRVGLIASPTGAALRDMIELLKQRWPMTQVLVCPSRVQGEGAAEEIAAKIGQLSRLHQQRQLILDVIVLGRGGGSIEDLWPFNEEIVAEAIHECVVPVVSAVGHETDVTIADLVADRRAETPSAAIMILVPDQQSVLMELGQRGRQLQHQMQQRLRQARQRVEQLKNRPALRRPLDRIQQMEQDLDLRGERLRRALARRLERCRDRLGAAAEHLESLSPLAVLKRGYSLTRRGDGRIVREASDVALGEILVTRFAVGEVRSRVVGATPPGESP